MLFEVLGEMPEGCLLGDNSRCIVASETTMGNEYVFQCLLSYSPWQNPYKVISFFEHIQSSCQSGRQRCMCDMHRQSVKQPPRQLHSHPPAPAWVENVTPEISIRVAM